MGKNILLEAVKEISEKAEKAGISHLQAGEVHGNTFLSKGKRLVHFGSCSYLGLEQDQRVMKSSSKAIADFGTQFSSSRAYVSCGLYEKLESNLSKIFDASVIVTPTTTLGHIASLPVLVGDQDAVIIDHQVHSSVQTAVQLLRARKIKVDMIRHSRMDMLEDRLKTYQDKYHKVWYLGDGVYSMYGDKAPLDDLHALMERYPNFHVYLDDAHAMCCYGDKGQGFVLDGRSLHPRLVLATSLNKAFASGGGVFITSNPDFHRDVRYCGGPLITSGPLQPANLGAGIAVSDILLSGEVVGMHTELKEKITYANMLIRKAGLPLVAENDTPVFFIGVGLPRVGYNLVQRMMKEGFFTNLGIFPAVPIKNTGLRFTITRLSNYDDIEELVSALAYHLPLALEEEKYSLQEVRGAFGMIQKEEEPHGLIDSLIKASGLKLETTQTIDRINSAEWDSLFKGKGMFDSHALSMMEKAYHENNELLEHRWDFDYIIIRDQQDKIVLATFLTTGLVKDDMLSPADVSQYVEEIRKKEDPYYLTSRVLTLGSFLSLGEHMFLDKNSEIWREALERCLEYILSLQEKRKAQSIMLRDFVRFDQDVVEVILNYGFLKMDFPDDHVICLQDFSSIDQYVASLSYKGRRHVRDTVRKNDIFNVQIVQEADAATVENWIALLTEVKKRNNAVNTFETIPDFFRQLNHHPEFEAIELRDKEGHLCSVILNHINGHSYDPMFIGMDYDYLEFGIYRKSLYHSIARAIELKKKYVGLGVTASFEKTRIGARKKTLYAFAMTKEHYNMEVLASIEDHTYS